MPHSVLLLDVHETSVSAELELPVDDFSRASAIDLTDATAVELSAKTTAIRRYLAAHLHPTTVRGKAWDVTFGEITLDRTRQTSTGTYRELTVQATLTPPSGGDPRHFVLDYDAIVHQVVTHIALISVRQDWATGRVSEEQDAATQVGVVRIDVRSMAVPALTINLESGSVWNGTFTMFRLGATHILEGTDHLLFLLILLLPAPLRAAGNRWRGTVGARTSINRIARTTLAFTIGHSLALALSAFGRLDIPAQPVEAFIAVSILVGAAHAIRPLFPGREAVVAGVFGLGHGLAFSLTLAEMNLSTAQLALSLLGFNLGIEGMQLLLVLLALPSLLLLSRLPRHSVVRCACAALTAAAALGWLLDRIGMPNPMARAADSAGSHTSQLFVVLIGTAALSVLRMGALYRRDRRLLHTTGVLNTDGHGRTAAADPGLTRERRAAAGNETFSRRIERRRPAHPAHSNGQSLHDQARRRAVRVGTVDADHEDSGEPHDR
ncbi:HupE/UreJ family protein [Streptomyces sp. NBC_01275]|uniref:HupE/UreJ family protein n=1 Tax=Streptomyces sp. NBC_01275 TaxID=2903807 RepID=UPI0022511E9E|nr:HupE/UreJ family protein [Streptomyces sp. NBC_01275]MCX4767900.1 HupE/UreJ family protein [Streptomyces sp. NBC_01275]